MTKFTEINAHRLVADLCVEMAQEVYEECATRHNGFYETYPDRAAYVRQIAPSLRQEARQTLTELLVMDSTSDADRRRIHHALILDAQIPQSGPWTPPYTRPAYFH